MITVTPEEWKEKTTFKDYMEISHAIREERKTGEPVFTNQFKQFGNVSTNAWIDFETFNIKIKEAT